MATFRIEFRPAAYRAYAKLDRSVKQRLAAALANLTDEPRPQGCKRLVGTAELWRIRVGSYRIVYAIKDDHLLILVVKIGLRGTVYRNL